MKATENALTEILNQTTVRGDTTKYTAAIVLASGYGVISVVGAYLIKVMLRGYEEKVGMSG